MIVEHDTLSPEVLELIKAFKILAKAVEQRKTRDLVDALSRLSLEENWTLSTLRIQFNQNAVLIDENVVK